MKTPVIFICQGALPNTPHLYVSPREAGEIIAKASTIVDTNLLDPGAALAFAKQGFGIAAASTCGAQEYIQGMASYDPADFSSILASVCRARGLRNHYVALPTISRTSLQAILDLTVPLIPDNPPLISIVVPTYNRKRELHATLRGLARQTYPNLEVIIVNDAGDAVDDIVSTFAFARCITLDENCKTTRAANIGLASARGEFVGLLADDDLDYPFHVAAIVASLHTSNLDVAHGNILIRLDTTLENGKRATYGHLLAHDGHLDHFEILYNMRISLQGCIIRTSTFRDIHFLNPKRCLASDYDALLRLSSQRDFVHADTVTGELSYRDDHSNISSKDKSSLASEIEELLSEHCPDQYPSMKLRHEATVRSVALAQNQDVFFRPVIPLKTPHVLSDD
jgi:glycosyltransferase involved in cell wall biosynthesis